MKVIEDILGNFCLLRCSCTPKFIKVTVKPLINLGVQGMVVIANLLASLPRLARFGLSSCSILVSTADEESVVTGKSCISGVDIG